MALKQFKHNHTFTLESGVTLPKYHLGYHTYGILNSTGTNVVWVYHALTANSDVADWWSGLFGAGKLFDPTTYFIVCVNIPTSHYGSSNAFDINPDTNAPYYHTYPFFTTRDIIKSFKPLQTYLGIKKIHIGIGGSVGGQQLLEWAIEEPELFENIIPIATNAKHSSWGIAFNASQRMAIEADATWQNNSATAGAEGLKVARSIALLSYRHYAAYEQSQVEKDNTLLDDYKVESYQKYQGAKLANRFNAFSYYNLTKTMDAHNVGRNRESVEKALQKIAANTLIIGISSDVLFPYQEQEYLAQHIKNAQLATITSNYGHDGFLLEYEQLIEHITGFLNKK
jgi:homoserine O-acetyltransferase/O-succinyltransferase